ncbi:MAG: amidohydrolase [Paludibacteraceae bacterium]|nr:amidohydrolase [Paludibacteraceae bacterium]
MKNERESKAFYNWHCHAAMTLLRGYGDNMPLQEWLQNKIWPREAKLTPEDIYWSSRLALIEMIKSGTVGFCDMYWMDEETERAVNESGMRALIGVFVLSAMDEKTLDEKFERLAEKSEQNGLVRYCIAPHAIYTCEERLLTRCVKASEKYNVPLHMHLSETRQEVEECKRAHGGLTPVEYSERLGLLTERSIMAHCVHLSDSDIDILAKSGARCVHNPCSNMKLGSGTMRWQAMIDKDVRVVLGTDGVSSNNNLSMFDEMKVAALQQSLVNGVMSVNAKDVYDAATVPLWEGCENDRIYIKRDSAQMLPENDWYSNMVYGADTSVVTKVVCDGKTLMENGKVEGEEEVYNYFQSKKA